MIFFADKWDHRRKSRIATRPLWTMKTIPSIDLPMHCSSLRSIIAFTAVALSVLSADAAGPIEKPLVAVTNPPPVQMLVPGFTVRELPLKLSNLNNLVFAPDGRLFALAYDGNVFQLKDTDDDGLEDTATHFFQNDRREIPASIGVAWGAGGIYIASQGRVIHLRDKGDGTSELKTVTGGWGSRSKAAGSNLDGIGLAVDVAGNIFFGIGCDDYSNAYRIDPQTGQSSYQLYSEQGTILKVSPDWKRREIVCTGTRWPVALAINAAGDLFCTDQEGATWLPNGNPFDELLHIQPGRHYGFPPRHPKHLPGVIDEPSVFDYAPQHQSTCGLHFNEPVAGSENIFGPAWWRGDAIVAGESRGKIWRTKLVKTAAGYVAQNNLIACLSMLTLDAVPTPRGDLLVICHSGAPDWGSGPSGQGKIFQISYTDKAAPQLALAYAVNATETRVTFDRPFDPTRWRSLASQSLLAMGEHVAAGDRFESFAPGYQAVKDQSVVRRYDLPVLTAGLAPDNRSLVLQTVPRTEALNYAVTLPEGGPTARAHDPNRRELPQQAALDLLTDLTGVAASWSSADRKTNWAGWLPHLDLTAARAFTGASEEHKQLFENLAGPGRLSLSAQLDLSLMLRTAVQPGAKLDFDYPAEIVTVVLKSSVNLDVKAGSGASVQKVGDREAHVTIFIQPKQTPWLPLEVTLQTGPSEPTLDVAWHTSEDLRPRALPLRRILLPWATPKTANSVIFAERKIPEVAGGDWQRGKKLFFSEASACSKCHQVGGEGGKLGPDLSNLIYRDYASVLKDITQPSAAINPDHISYSVALKNGESASGIIVEDTPLNLVLGQATGGNLPIPKNTIAEVKASALSFMPEGLWQALNAEQQRDLMTFLLLTPATANRN